MNIKVYNIKIKKGCGGGATVVVVVVPGPWGWSRYTRLESDWHGWRAANI